MARWKLMCSHYLNVPGEVWEYTENDRSNGRPIRKQFAVPRLLDVKDPTCWTKRWGNRSDEDGEIIVCHEGKGSSTDIVFLGDPTPDMLPVDDEAKAISAKFEERWKMKPEANAGDFSQALVDRFQLEMAEKQSRPQTVEVAGLNELVTSIGKLIESVPAPRRI